MEKFTIGMDIRDVVTVANMNEIADAVNKIKENGNGVTRPGANRRAGYRSGEIRIKNSEEISFEQFSAVSLIDLELTPANCDDFAFEVPTFVAGTVTAVRQTNPFAILLEPANPGELALAIVSGVTPASVLIVNAEHQYAKPSLTSPGALESCEAGIVRILWKAGNNGMQCCILQIGATNAQQIDLEQFRIVDASIYDNDTGAITTPRIKVIAGTDANTTYSGSLNGRAYYCASPIELTVTSATRHYVYAIDGGIYVLADRTWSNNLIPSALIGTVEVGASSLTIRQQVVPLSVFTSPALTATSEIRYTISYTASTERISVAYSYHGTYIKNGTAITADFILGVGDKVIRGYVETLTIGINETPLIGVVQQDRTASMPSAEFVTTFLAYQWLSTATQESFYMNYRQESPELSTYVAMTRCNCAG